VLSVQPDGCSFVVAHSLIVVISLSLAEKGVQGRCAQEAAVAAAGAGRQEREGTLICTHFCPLLKALIYSGLYAQLQHQEVSKFASSRHTRFGTMLQVIS
jgi:hypothetical protein